MKTLDIEYKPTGGLVVADGEVLEVAQRLIDEGKPVVISSDLIFDAIRVIVRESTEEIFVTVKVYDKTVQVRGDGRLPSWPHPLGNTQSHLLSRLL